MTPHPADKFLIGMHTTFESLFLWIAAVRASLACRSNRSCRPTFCHFIPTHRDCSITIANHRLPAMCVYSGAIFQFAPGTDRIVQFLDQVATYLARHAIWLRTRVLFRCNAVGKDKIEDRPKPGEMIVDTETKESFDKKHGDLYWNGYWPGNTAPSGSEAHLADRNRNEPCWCWSGKPYKDAINSDGADVAEDSTAGCPTLDSEMGASREGATGVPASGLG